ncbi:thiamine phosphate synthase [Azospirillum agricola]|uniref:thiamine phosphate synthase n=1 Tax=Azospirillum agricola TaxID=1720247 RepID=UPI000A0F03D5|nr:thiamine phosphate synthase [Azospirillum agricola]SMH48276.1 thiamine-phosphate pyrophosphorylase [Azospirillum lipoferum]
MPPFPPLLVITDRKQAIRPLPELAGDLFELGVRWLSLRDKDLPDSVRLDLARALVGRARRWSALVTLHGDPALALAAGAAGVHLPDGGDTPDALAAARALLGPGALVGVSAHDAAGLARAAAGGADYATLSPIFPSASKPGYGPWLEADGLRRMAAGAGLPVIALGGVESPDAARACRRAGAAGVAAMGLAMRAPPAVAGLLAALSAASPEG